MQKLILTGCLVFGYGIFIRVEAKNVEWNVSVDSLASIRKLVEAKEANDIQADGT